MKKIVYDIYDIFLGLLKIPIAAYLLTVSIVSVLEFFILNGLIHLFEDLLPIKPLEILFANKMQYITTAALLVLNFIINLSCISSNPKRMGRRDYVQLVIFILISILLYSYMKFISMAD